VKFLVAFLLTFAHGDFRHETSPYRPFKKVTGFTLLVANPGSALVKAGAQKGDIVMSVNDRKITSLKVAKWAFRQKKIRGMTVIRDGRLLMLLPEFTERP
jgi:type II secretory pathway component PulC